MLKLDSLSYHFPNSNMVLDNVSLEFQEGNIYGLFGKNGEGKSTLMKIMAGLLFPKRGQCNVFGQHPSKRTASCLQQIFMLPEDFELPNLSIAKHEATHSPFYPGFNKIQFYQLLKEFKLEPHEKINSLSYGQRKKFLIAFGIATNTKLLLMDEPTNGLDIPSKSQFRRVMAAAVGQGRCILISTHQVRDLHSLINHVVILDQHKVAFDHSLLAVSEGLWFGRSSNFEKEDVIYDESSFGGKAVLCRLNREETDVDLELLFNAVLNNPEAVNQAIKNSYHGV